MLFNETLLYNLQYGDHNKTQEEVMEAATMAQIPPKLLYNMEMKVGERGSKLSGVYIRLTHTYNCVRQRLKEKCSGECWCAPFLLWFV